MARAASRAGAWRLVVALAALAATGASHQLMDTASKVDRGELFVPGPEQVRASTLGFDALVADYYWLQVIQILGTERAGIGDKAPLVARLLDVVTTVDPWVGHPYRFAAVWLTDSPESVRAANRLLERGVAYHPREWRNRHYLGFNHFFYLGDQTTAADWIESAVGLPRAPRYLGGLAAKLRMERDGLETAAAFLTRLAAESQDEYARAEYLKDLDEVDTERRARLLDRAREEYRRRHGRDIEQVEDLLLGSRPVLRALPPAHPQFRDFRWTLDEETGEIVSSFYGGRYRTFETEVDRERRERWLQEQEARELQDPQELPEQQERA